VQPVRLVLDSIAAIRAMAAEPFTYRRQMLALKNALVARGCTTLITDELLTLQDMHLRTLAHGVLQLFQDRAPFGSERRQLEILKMRGMQVRGGCHDLVLTTGGLRVFPRLVAEGRTTDGVGALLSTGVAALDTLLGGGLDRGTATLCIGAAGT